MLLHTGKLPPQCLFIYVDTRDKDNEMDTMIVVGHSNDVHNIFYSIKLSHTLIAHATL